MRTAGSFAAALTMAMREAQEGRLDFVGDGTAETTAVESLLSHASL